MHFLSYFTLILPSFTFYLITVIFQYLWLLHHTVGCQLSVLCSYDKPVSRKWQLIVVG